MDKLKKIIPAIASIAIVIIILCSVFLKKEPEQYMKAYIDIFDTVTQFIGYADTQ